MNVNGFSSVIDRKLAPFEQWISDQELKHIYSGSYWNDIEEEKKKDWWIADGNYSRCLDYLSRSGLLDEWSIGEAFINNISDKANLVVADLAAGIGWTSALLSKLENINVVHAVEISKHRLVDLFPHAVTMLDGSPEKIKRYVGSFYELGFEDESIDIVFMSQAFHHSDRPLKLLSEMDRITRRGGCVVLMGENLVGIYAQIKRVVKIFVKTGRLSLNFYKNFPPDQISGDHYYRLTDYYLFFSLLGYKLSHRVVNGSSLVFIAAKS